MPEGRRPPASRSLDQSLVVAKRKCCWFSVLHPAREEARTDERRERGQVSSSVSDTFPSGLLLLPHPSHVACLPPSTTEPHIVHGKKQEEKKKKKGKWWRRKELLSTTWELEKKRGKKEEEECAPPSLRMGQHNVRIQIRERKGAGRRKRRKEKQQPRVWIKGKPGKHSPPQIKEREAEAQLRTSTRHQLMRLSITNQLGRTAHANIS